MNCLFFPVVTDRTDGPFSRGWDNCLIKSELTLFIKCFILNTIWVKTLFHSLPLFRTVYVSVVSD